MSQQNVKDDGKAKVSFLKLFRYATWSDVLMMVLAAVASFFHGSAFPVAMTVFGRITNAFINQAKSNTLYQLILCSPDGTASANLTLITAPPTNCSQLLALPTDPDLLALPTDPDLVCQSYEAILKLIGGNGTQCLTNDLFIREINTQVYIFIGVAVLAFLFGVVQIWFFKVPTEHQIHKIRLKLYASILKKDSAWIDLHDSGSTMSNLSNGVETMHGAIGDNIGVLIQWLSTFLAAIIVSLVIQYQLALLLLAIVPLMGIAGYSFTKLGGVFSTLEQKFFALAGGVAQEVLGSITTVQVYGGEEREQKRFDENLEKTNKFGVYKGLAIGSSVGSVYFLTFLVYSVSFWFGAFLVSRELAELGDVITVFFSILIGAFYLGQAGPNLQKLAEAQAAAAPIYAIIDEELDIDSLSDKGLVPLTFDPSVTFKDVKFVFPSRPEVKILEGFNLTISPGQKIALVGSSGSGKSTVIKLIQRLYDTLSGEVLVGGVNVKDLNLKWLRAHIGVVSQEPGLFDITVANNIALGKENATSDEIEAAATKANAHDFIMSLPEGYDTHVGEGGAQLSGGQKQRIAIARALVRDPKILLLDEATSALDTKSESIVQEALDKACAGRTTITVAHRLSTIRDAHVILAMEAGQVVEKGTHAELMDAKGKYFDLVNAQEVDVPGTPTMHARRGSTLSRHSRSSSFGSSYSFLIRSGKKGGSPERQKRIVSSLFPENHDLELRPRSRSALIVGKKNKEGLSFTRIDSSLKPKPQPVKVEDDEDERFITPYKSTEEQEEGEMEVDKEEVIPTISPYKLLSYNYKMFPVILLGCVGAFVNGLVFPLFSIIFGEVVTVFGGPPGEILQEIHPYAAGFLALGVVSAVSVFIKFVCFNISGFHLASIVRRLLFKAFLQQDKAWYDREENSTGALTTMLSMDAYLVQGVAGIRFGSLLEVAVSLLCALGVAFGYSWVTAFVILGFMPVVVLASILHYSISNRTLADSLEGLTESTQLAVESVNLIQTVQAFGLEELFYTRFKELSSPSYRRALRFSFIFGITYAFSQVIVFFAYIITFRFGAFQVTLSSDNIASAMFQDVYRAFAAIIFVSIGAGAVGAFIPDASKANAAAEKVFKVINRPLVIDGTSELGHRPDNCGGLVQFNDVEFSYPSRKDVKILDRMKLTVKGNCTVGLVGASGCGKSTIMSLLLRFYDPRCGFISLDGTNIRDLNLKWLRSQVGLVAQEPVLFDASIADNIRYGALFRDVSEDEIISAAKQANIHDFIETLPMGYNTNVGAKGTQLSGGQKQRVAIARALVRDPKILLLDEATSALDTESEKVVQEALDKAREGRTTIVIAHRLSTIQNANKIVILEGGKLVEQGTHTELLERKEGIYYRMVYSRNKAWRPDSMMAHLKRPLGLSVSMNN